jgi:hypothetical protein
MLAGKNHVRHIATEDEQLLLNYHLGQRHNNLKEPLSDVIDKSSTLMRSQEQASSELENLNAT